MIKLVVKLGIAALIANAAWQAGRTFADHYEYRDIPLAAEAVSIRREERHIYVEGSYVRIVPIAPRVEYPWKFDWEVDAYIIDPDK